MSLGLSATDAKVYTFLATRGPQRTQKIMEELKLQEHVLFQSLNILVGKGVVSSIQEHSALFNALPFAEALELLVKDQLRQAQIIEQGKDGILSEWKNASRDSKRTNAIT